MAKKKTQGWLDSYEYGGEAGYTDVPFDYNSAWGGQFQLGGNVYPVNYVPQAQTGDKLSSTDENSFQEFFKTLPINLRKDQPDYNMRGYWDALGRPSEFDYSQPKEDDGYYHAFSRNPQTGEILKAPFHHTFDKAIDRGNPDYFPIVTPEGKIKTVTGRQYEKQEDIPVGVPLRENLELKMGGNIVKAQNGLWTTDKRGYVDSVLNANKNLDWVKRMYDPHPKAIMVPGEPHPSTHLMGDNGQGYVFPTIVNMNGQLVDLGRRGEDYARETNTGIQFPVEQGTWFANSTSDKSGYKMGTGVMKGKPVMQKYKSIDKHAMGGSIGGTLPGSTGFMYARIGAPSNGPYAKKTKASAQDGKEVAIDPSTNPTYAQPLSEALQYTNDWMNSPMYKQMLSNSLKGRKKDYENLDRRRKSVIQDGKINYYEESVDPRTSAESEYVGKGKSNMYFNRASIYPDWLNNITHELSHITDAGGLGIPLADQKLMRKYATHDIKDSPLYQKAKETGTLDELKQFTNYVNAPTETRARLNTLRKLMNDQQVYDPFTQPFSKDMFSKYKQIDINEEDKKAGHTIGMDPYQQLRMSYTDEEIEDMMNKISKTDNYITPIAQNGMSFYQHGLDWKPRTISKKGSVIKDNRGQWAHPGEITEIDSNNITMHGVPYPVLGIGKDGQQILMQPGQDYKFSKGPVTEFPMMQKGGTLSPVYVSNPNDPRLKLYNDSLTTFQKSQNPWFWPGTKITTKQDYEKKLDLQRDFPSWSFDEDQYKKDKKKGKFKDFNDYMYDVTLADNLGSREADAYQRNVGKDFEDLKIPIEKKLPDGRIKQYHQKYKDKVDESDYQIYDPITGSYSSYSNNDFLGLYNPNIKPIGHIYHAFNNPITTGETAISSEDSEYINKVLKNKSSKKKDYKNYTYGASDSEIYKEPVQPVIYDKKKYNPNDPRLKQLQQSFEAFHSGIKGNSKKQTNEQPKPEPTLKKKVTQMQPISGAQSSFNPGIRTIDVPGIQEVPVQKGQYRTSYYDSQMKDWNERTFMSQQESDQFANEMSQRGYPGSYGNVTQTKKVNKKSNGGWLDAYK